MRWAPLSLVTQRAPRRAPLPFPPTTDLLTCWKNSADHAGNRVINSLCGDRKGIGAALPECVAGLVGNKGRVSPPLVLTGGQAGEAVVVAAVVGEGQGWAMEAGLVLIDSELHNKSCGGVAALASFQRQCNNRQATRCSASHRRQITNVGQKVVLVGHFVSRSLFFHFLPFLL